MRPTATVLCIVGTRPEAIKTSPVVRELRSRGIATRLCLTGQHPALGAAALAGCGLAADIVCTLEHPPTPVAVRMALEAPLRRVRPSMVLVHGDTSSTLGGALAARAAGVSIAHVEAGLRSHDLMAPYPEELYRRVVDRLSALHLAPTVLAAQNLRSEGIGPTGVSVTGNTGIDALHSVLARQSAAPPRERIVLVTAHRRENLGAPLWRIVGALDRLAQRYPQFEFLVPVHPNPEIGPALSSLRRPNVQRLPPLPHPEFVELMQRAHVVLTDSGGIQEEAPVLGTPVLVLRDNTERPEGVAAGTALLVGTDPERILAETSRLLEDPAHHARMSRVHSPYGDGRAAARIAAVIEERLEEPAAAIR